MWAFNDSNVEIAYFTDSATAFTSCAINNDGSTILGGTAKGASNSFLYVYTETCALCQTG